MFSYSSFYTTCTQNKKTTWENLTSYLLSTCCWTTSLIGTTVIISSGCANSVATFCWQKSKKALTQTLSIYLRRETLQSNTIWLRAQKDSSICCRLIRTSFLLCFANHCSMITTKSIPRFRQSSHSAQQPLLPLCVGGGGFGPRVWQSMSISKHLPHIQTMQEGLIGKHDLQ